jgi:hypothetical protein
MNTNEINIKLSSIKNFIGTFPRNLLPKSKIKKPAFLVINTDPSNKPGEHWVAVYLSKNNIAEYFDSYGIKSIHDDVYNFFQNNDIKKVIYNPYQLQSIITTTCGNYCVLYIKLRDSGLTFCKFIKLFTNNELINDINTYLTSL